MKYVMRLILVAVVLISLGSQSIAMAFEQFAFDIEKLPEWKVKQSSVGRKLLLSDSPEMVEDDGIVYQDKVEGKVRLFFYHVNASVNIKKMDVILENNGRENAHITISQSSLGGPGYDWLAVGKQTMMSYLTGQGGYQITVPPGGAIPLSSNISETAISPNMLINGIFDFVTDRSVNVKVMMLPVLTDSAKVSKSARVLEADEDHLRGTFDGADRQVSSIKAYDPLRDGAVGLTLADNVQDSYLRGIDATNGTNVINYGNYGVVYQILLPSHKGGKIAYYLAPMGGQYAGAIGINYPDVRWTPMATPMGSLYFGTVKKDEGAFLGTYDSGDPLSFTFSPPGASNLPVKIVILPQ